MRFFFLISIVLFGCKNSEQSPQIGLPISLSFVVYDYGNEGNSKDILLGVTFAASVPSEVEVRVVISKSEEIFTEEMAESLATDQYQTLQMEGDSFRANVSKELDDAQGEDVKENKLYAIYLCIVGPNSEMKIIRADTDLVLREKDLLDAYTLSQSITGHNPYLLEEKSIVAENIHSALDMIFDSEGKILLLSEEGSVTEYDGEGSFERELISKNELANPKILRLGPDGKIYIIDGSSVVQFSRSGEFLEVYLDNLISPGSLAWDQSGRLYITEKIKRGRILTFYSKEIINEFSFYHTSIIPKSVFFNEAEQKIYINRTSVNGTGIVSLDPGTFEWQLLGSLELFGTFSDIFVNNQAGHTLIIKEDGLEGPQIVVVAYKDAELQILETSAPLQNMPTSIALGPKKD